MAKTSPVGRVSYPHVFKPNNFEGKESFQLTLLFDKNDPGLEEMKAEAKRVADEFFPNGRPSSFRSPFIDGDTKDQPEYKGKIAVKFSTKVDRKPQVVGPDLKLIDEQSGKFYAGCHAKVSYAAFAYKHKLGGSGVSFALNNIQKVRDDVAFDGRTNAEDDFEAMAVAQAAGDAPMF